MNVKFYESDFEDLSFKSLGAQLRLWEQSISPCFQFIK